MPLRAMTFNLLHGGRPDRRDAIERVIAAQCPDVLALQELAGFDRDGAKVMAGLADRLGMRPFLARSWFGQPVAVLVREDARVLRAGPLRRPFHHGASRVVLDTAGGPLTVIGTHLYPWSGGRRLQEARWLSAQCRADLSRPGATVLLMGDLNSLDPWTDHTQPMTDLSPQYRSRHTRRDGTVDTRAVATLEAAGLVDVFRHTGSAGLGWTAPSLGPGGHEFSRLRLDYVLASPALAALARSCRVVEEAEAATASDHYPVVADFAIELLNGPPEPLDLNTIRTD